MIISRATINTLAEQHVALAAQGLPVPRHPYPAHSDYEAAYMEAFDEALVAALAKATAARAQEEVMACA